MTDIIDTLRQRYRLDPIIQDAADEIEQLRFDVNLLSLIVSVLEGKDDNPTDADDTNGHPEGAS